jgi:hypothetical protein
MKFFQRYLCELCANAIVRAHRQDEYEFVICAQNTNGFPLSRKCSNFTLEEMMVE